MHIYYYSDCYLTKLNKILISPKNKCFKIIDDKLVLGKSDKDSEDFDLLVFAYRNIEKATIPSYIKQLCPYCFSNCQNLQEIKFQPNSELLIIGKYAFSRSSISNITIPSSVTTIEEYVFNECRNLRNIDFSDNSNLYKTGPFTVLWENDYYPSITIPPNIKSIGAFYGFFNNNRKSKFSGISKISDVMISPENKNFKIIDDCLVLSKSDKNSEDFDLLVFAYRDIEKVTIPSYIKQICSYCFSYRNIKIIEFQPKSELHIICRCAFYSSVISSITIPSSVTIIDEYAFYNCDNFQKIEFSENSELRRIGKYAFSKDCYNGITSDLTIKIPPNVTIIEESAFQSCKLQNIEFYENSELKTICKSAFKNTLINSIKIPPSVTTIEEDAFYIYKKPQNIEFPENSELKTINLNAFYESIISTITIPSNVEKIEIPYYKNLNKIIISPENKNFKIIDDSLILGKSDKNSEDFDLLIFAYRNIEKATIPSYIKQLCPNCFSNCQNLQEIKFQPNSELHIICKGAFSNSSLPSITIPSSVTTIEENAFSSCKKLENIEFSPNPELRIIFDYAFSDSAISTIMIPQHVSIIAKGSFLNCKNLEKVDFSPNSELCYIGDYAFKCTKISSIKIPAHVTIIEERAFEDCNLNNFEFDPNSEIRTIHLKLNDYALNMKFCCPPNLESISPYNYNHFNLAHITIPPTNKNIKIVDDTFILAKSNKNSDEFDLLLFAIPKEDKCIIPPYIKRICKKCFYKQYFKSIIIPPSVTMIEENAFYSCHYLENIEFSGNSCLQIICKNAFNSCYQIEDFKIPQNVTTIEDKAFKDCRNIKNIKFSENSEIRTINMHGFGNCPIKSIEIPPKVEKLIFVDYFFGQKIKL